MGAGRVQYKQIVIVGRGTDGIGPEQNREALFAIGSCDGVVIRRAETVNQSIRGKSHGAAVGKITFPSPGKIAVQISGIGSGGKVEASIGHYGVNGLGFYKVLKWRFGRRGDVVHNDVAVVHEPQIEDVGGKLR